ncbi:MAG: hypothetical protein EPO07_09680 [Verrucomicrobia bacterium]|nr:MAG: hypothetical protein EPO07_09680 [Verrucomicrobiota bacterium]
MKAKEFLKQVRHDEIVAAIRASEQKTSGEIRVFVSHKEVEAPVGAAQVEFARLGMAKTRERNGVLIFVAPLTRKFAVIGDKAVHEKCGDEFWRTLADEMSGHFKSGDFTAGLVHSIHKAGELLAQHFPHRPDDRNELPDRVEQD